MRHYYTIFCISALLLLAACGGSRYERMRLQLDSLQVLNQSDSLLTDDSLALDLTQYFDSHGSANERMLAHYLLARTYADRGEAPQALDEFHTAAECADTTSEDCDYAQLCRVYSQMGYLLFQQNLIDDYLSSLDNAISYAKIADDTLSELNLYGQKMNAYRRLGRNDSLVSVYENLVAKCDRFGKEKLAACFSAVPIESYLAKGNIIQAKKCIDFYEGQSGFFDEEGNIAAGREFYYYFKGQYYMSLEQYDSARYYFYKELQNGHDYYNQNMASKGLALLYKQIHRPDPSAKYALYSYSMNDSAHAQMISEKIAVVKGLYNYTAQQKLTIAERQRADKEQKKVYMLIAVIFIIVVLFCFIGLQWKEKRKRERQLYMQNLEKLEQAKSDVRKLNRHVKENHELIQEKEAFVREMSAELEKFRNRERLANDESEARLQISSDYFLLHKKADKGLLLSEEEKCRIIELTANVLPGFYKMISSKEYYLGSNEQLICILLRLHVSATSAGFLLGVSEPYVSKTSKKVLERVFGESGSSKKLASVLSKIN